MKVLVTIYKDGETTPFNNLRLSVEEEEYLEELVSDIDEFLEEQFNEIKEGEDE